MAKKKNKAETILRRAEKLFNAGNFLLAEKEFLKIRNKIDHVDIDQKLEVCRKETRSVKARQLIKDGHKAVQNEDLSRAIAFFKDANELVPDPSLMDKIKELRDRLLLEKRGDAAQQAVAAHDYAGAAALYARAWEETGEQEFLGKNALNLVKAKTYEAAVEQFERLDHPEPEAVYAWGVALAKIHHYCRAMEQWAQLDLNDPRFVQQKKGLFELACSAVYEGLKKATDVQTCLHDAQFLLSIAQSLGSKAQAHVSTLGKVCEYYRLLLVEDLWKQENYMGVAELLEGMPTFVDPELLALHAKCYFHLSRDQADFLSPMMTFWLTAIYSRQVSDGFSHDSGVKEKVQQKLIRMAEQRINGHGNLQSTRRAEVYLGIEKKLINDLFLISQLQPGSECPITTPGYALISGSSDTIVDVIRKNRNYFKDELHYLETGGYYSRAGEALYALKIGKLKESMEFIDAMEPQGDVDEFVHYVSCAVQFENGLFVLKHHNKLLLKYFKSTHELFIAVPSIEKEFTDLMLQYEGNQLLIHEELLLYLHKQHPTALLGKALSFMMAQSAIQRYNRKKINNKQVKVALEKALNLDANNELAYETLEQTCIELETEAVYSAINRHKLNKAARLTADSVYSQVYDNFFEFMGEIVDDFKQTDISLDNAVKRVYLNDFINAVLIVDARHPLRHKIQADIDRME
mgnify:CR=1 FL=1